LRSVREVVTSAGTVFARYQYGPFGQRSAIAETIRPPLGFGGYFQHEPSGLSLTLFRPYSSAQGRWLSRDPMGEAAGANLYAYVGNNPVNFFDSLGLCAEPPGGDGAPQTWEQFKNDFFDLSKITGFADAYWGTWKDLLQNTRYKLPEAKWLGDLDLALNAADLMDDPTLGKLTSVGLSIFDKYPAVKWFNRGVTFGQVGTQELYNQAVKAMGQDAVDLTLADWGDNWFWQGVDRVTSVFNHPLLP
jgi:RHS repeat-associated protein